ncbi:MAG: hypothetical protein AB4372_05620 [Xenococcus sp. (in: cyanobacteria)]
MNGHKILAARIEQDLSQIALVVEAATSQVKKADQTGDLDYLQAATLSLQNMYMGVERIFEEIAKQVDDSLPTGASSHGDLLRQMTLTIAEVRPPVINSELFKQLNEYRGFRHVAIHRYGFELRQERIRELVADLPACYQAFSQQLQDFCEFLKLLDS